MKNDDMSVVAETIETVALGSGGQVVAQFSVSPGSPTALSSVRLDATASGCRDNDDIVEYLWCFGEQPTIASRKPVIEHNFPKAGNLDVSLVVRTRSGHRAEIRKSVRVGFRLGLEHEPRCPLISRPVRFVAKAFVNLHAADGIAEYAWDLNGDGAFERSSRDGEVCHMYETAGTYTVAVRATSVKGITEEATHSLTVVEMTRPAGLQA